MAETACEVTAKRDDTPRRVRIAPEGGLWKRLAWPYEQRGSEEEH